jgi:superfamily II DNA or RNA helicase
MNSLKIENTFSWFISDNEEIKTFLWKSLRFRARNYWHNARYKMKVWDGYNEFFKKDSGRFLTGLLPEVKSALCHLGIDYEVDDRRNSFDFTVKEIDKDFLNQWLSPGQKPVTLYDYQVEYVNQIIRNKRGIITAPTGAGKSLNFIALLKTLPPNTPTLILANRKSLVEQNYDEIMKWGFNNVGRLYQDKKDPNVITCATVQSAYLLKPIFNKIKVLIVDEIHEMMSKRPRSIYSRLDECVVRVGMSATAFKFGGTDKVQKYEVKGWIGPQFALKNEEKGKLTTKKLQERDILSLANCIFYNVNEPNLPYEIYQDAVTRGIAENNYFHDMVANLVRGLTGRTLIIVERIEHGDRLQDRIPGALWVRGQDNVETRKEVIKRLKTEKGNVVAIASQIFNTGIDVYLHNLCNAAGGQADHQIIQRFGRGLRIAEDKSHLRYFDFIFNINDYLYKHSIKRVKILRKEGHEVVIKEKLDE